MKVVIINRSDATGGAAVVSARLMTALRAAGVDARMLVAEKLKDSAYVELAASRAALRKAFLTERLSIFMANGFNRDTLFKIDTAADGVPLWRHKWVLEADVICLNWINQGMLSLEGIRHLATLGKPLVWTMHDMWCATGVCHHAYGCTAYERQCGDCPLLGSKASPGDISHKVWTRKQTLYSGVPLHFVAVSHWLADRCRSSSLMASMPLSIIPNAFPVDDLPPLRRRENDDKVRVVMGAARLDDPIKGLPILVEATKVLAADYPDLAHRMELVTFGAIRDPHALDSVAVSHRHLGTLHGDDNIRRVYDEGHVVVSASHFETLPGTLVEGQAYGCIPVSFDRGGQPDIIDHRLTGWLAHMSGDTTADASALAEGIAWAAHCGHDVRQQARRSVCLRFSSHVVAKQYIDLFDSLLGHKA